MPLTDASNSLESLLEQWEELRAQGHNVDLADLCQGQPTLLAELELRVAALEKFSKLSPTRGCSATEATVGNALPIVPAFEVLREIGRGGMGVVYHAKQIGLNRAVALKMILTGQFADQRAKLRFQIEGESLARMQHPNILQVFEVGALTDPDTGIARPFLVLELAAGGTLEDRIRSRPCSPTQSAAIVATLANAVQYAHLHGVIHRDLKPGNILFLEAESPEGSLDQNGLKIADFGLVRLVDRKENAASTGSLVGTPGYVPPELCRGELDQLGPTTDVFALGAILFRLLTGRLPFEGKSGFEIFRSTVESMPLPPRRVNPQIPRDLENICLKCLAKSPAERYRSAQALEDDLHRYLGGMPTHARPVGVIERVWKWAKRRPAVAALGSALTVALAAAGGVVIAANISLASANRRERLAREEAERNFNQARAAVDDYFTTISQQELTKAPGAQQLRKALLTKALEYYKDFVARRGADPQNRANVASSLMKVAQIVAETESSHASIAWYEKAIAALRALCADYPEDIAFRRALAEALDLIAVELRRTGKPEESRAAVAEAIDILAPTAGDFESQRQLGRSYANLSAALGSLGKNREAINVAKRGLEIRRELAKQTPNDVRIVRVNATAYINLGCDQLDLFDLPAAAKSFESARAIAAELQSRPDGKTLDRTVGADLDDLSAIACANLGKVQFECGKLKESLSSYESGIQNWERLLAANGGIANYRWKLCFGLAGRGETLAGLHLWADAMASFERACLGARELLKNNPTDALAASQLGYAFDGKAWTFANRGKIADAESAFAQAKSAHDRAIQLAPAMLEVQLGIANHFLYKARSYRVQGKSVKAIEAARESMQKAGKAIRPFILAVRELSHCGADAEAHASVAAAVSAGWLEPHWLAGWRCQNQANP